MRFGSNKSIWKKFREYLAIQTALIFVAKEITVVKLRRCGLLSSWHMHVQATEAGWSVPDGNRRRGSSARRHLHGDGMQLQRTSCHASVCLPLTRSYTRFTLLLLCTALVKCMHLVFPKPHVPVMKKVLTFM